MTRALIGFSLALMAGSSLEAESGGSFIAVRAIPAGEVISASDMVRGRATTPGAASSIEEAQGLETRTLIYPGGPILIANLQAPALVERNGLVEMQFERGVLTIRTEGRALDRGALGERVRVMNLSSRAIVTAIVTAEGSVSVTGGAIE